MSRGHTVFKVCVVGDPGVGKTQLTSRYTQNTFSNLYRATIGVDFHLKSLSISGSADPGGDADEVRLALWDLAGQERFGRMTSAYYKQAKAFVIVYDCTRPSTLDGAAKWLKDIRDKNSDSFPLIYLVAAKSDLDASVPKPEGGVWEGVPVYAVSAKENTGLDELFGKIAQTLYDSENGVDADPVGAAANSGLANDVVGKLQAHKEMLDDRWFQHRWYGLAFENSKLVLRGKGFSAADKVAAINACIEGGELTAEQVKILRDGRTGEILYDHNLNVAEGVAQYPILARGTEI